MDGEDKLPDLLQRGMTVVFVGTAAGEESARRGAYYAKPGNRFWRTLAEVGITPRLFAPEEFRNVAKLGMGFTDVVKSAAGADHSADVALALKGAPVEFASKMRAYRPAGVAFTSKRAASVFLEKPTSLIAYGRLCPPVADFPEIFVLPSTSGAASSHWTIEPWQELAAWYKQRRLTGQSLRQD